MNSMVQHELVHKEHELRHKYHKEWYAVYTSVRHEKTVNSALDEKGIETFLPLREEVSNWKDRKKKVLFPLFPGYLFVNTPVQDRWDILNTRGVVRILGVNGTPTPIPVEQIVAIRRLLEKNLKYDPYPYLTKGIQVEVIKGPLSGVRGIILDKRGKYKLILSVDMLKRAVSIEVDIGDVELL